tara:strand:+ start:183 stop:695 length:513 start_codon:yes stop_codon:yes gene_type:complete
MFLAMPIFSQVGIGTTNPNNSAMLDVSSTTSGFLLPRMTSVQRDAISLPAIGLLIFNTDNKAIETNLGTTVVPKWNEIANNNTQSGTYNVGSTITGWNYYDVVFATTFTAVPAIILTFREGVGIDNAGSNSVTHFKVANAATTGFTIGVYETLGTNDVFIDWVAIPKTQL